LKEVIFEMSEKNEEVKMVAVDLLSESPTNPRRDFDDGELAALAASVKEVGIQQALIVRACAHGVLEIVAGERRWRAAKLLGMGAVPCLVRELSDEEVLEIQIVENDQRAGLSEVESAEGVERLSERTGWDADLVGKKLGRGVSWVQDRLNLKLAPEPLRDAVGKGLVRLSSVRRVMEVEEEDVRESLGQTVLSLGEVLSDEEVNRMVVEKYEKPRRNLEGWRSWVSGVSGQEAFERCMFLDDPADWAKYVRPYGEAVSPWKLETDQVGGLAARPEDAAVTWGTLAKLHGVPLLVVPVGGYQEGCGNVRRVVDRSLVEDAERGRKESGEEYVLGARLKGRELDDDSDKEDDSGGVDVEVPAELVTRESEWNPWLLLSVEFRADAARLAVDVLDFSGSDWRLSAERLLGIDPGELDEFVLSEFETFLPVVVWWCLEGLAVDDRGGIRLASAFGVLEFWRGRVS
jgi:ParB/RepB/Spo0J family partition protein